MLNDYCREEKTSGLTDARFLQTGLERCMGQYDSGRDFLQKLADNGEGLARATFFDALKQERRRVIKEVTERTALYAAKVMAEVDWLKSVPSLGDRQVWTIDGHQIEHACHALLDKGGKLVPPGCLYAFDLHKGLMHPICTHQGNGQRTAEIKAFRKAFSARIARKGFPVRPIVVADMAFIDGNYWTKLRLNSPAAPVIITRQKENMNPISYAHPSGFSRGQTAPRWRLSDGIPDGTPVPFGEPLGQKKSRPASCGTGQGRAVGVKSRAYRRPA
jgi:hypothetical protein